ncbi:MAG: hypothetical protein ACXWZM_01855 [Solirubrobacterales bacterium]
MIASSARERRGHRVRRLAAACALLAGVFLAADPAPAAVVTFGSSLPAPSSGYYDSCSEACSTAQVELPGTSVTSPVTGRVVKFRIRTDAGSDPQNLRFRVLRSDDGKKFTGVGTSAAFPISTSAGITEYAVDMPIEEGDHIGIDQAGGGVRARMIRVEEDAFQAGWFPRLGDGKPPRASGNPKGSPPTRYELLLQADVEPILGPAASTCTNRTTLLATCADPDGLPSVCGPGAIFPQCHLPVHLLPAACGGQGSGLPTCQLPRNEVVACGSLGIGLGVPACGKLPPPQVPGVCGPTTVGLPPCSLANNTVMVCGPPSLGFPPCAFKSFIKAPKPIDPTEPRPSKPIGHESSRAHLEAVLTCPEPAEGTPDAPKSCPVTVDLEAEMEAEIASLQRYARELSAAWRTPDLTGFEYELRNYGQDELRRAKASNARQFVDRADFWLDVKFVFAKAGKFKNRMTDQEQDHLVMDLRRLSAVSGSYEGPTILFDNPGTLAAARSFAVSLRWAIGHLHLLQQEVEKNPGKRALTAAAVRSVAGASAARRPLLERRFRLRRGMRNRIKIRLPQRVVRALVKGAPRRARKVPVRLVFTFKAKPRPIVRVIDVPLRIKRKRSAR